MPIALKRAEVDPCLVVDYLALVGDAADGIPGIPRWGAKSTATVLAAYGNLESIPERVEDWTVRPRGAAALAKNLAEQREQAGLYKKLATLRIDVPLEESLEDLRWQGAVREQLEPFCAEIEDLAALKRITQWQKQK